MEGTPKAIELQGIVRNATKIGVQDGQAEDLINLRFMDGSWRASGNGRQIVNMPTGTIYQQLYVHTNVYHHLLGVDNGTLYWFAEIDNDGVTFYPLDGTTDRSQWPEDKQDLPTAPVALTTVVGDVWITQTGHLLTVIDGADDFEHFVFKTGEDKYIEVNIDVNGKVTDGEIYPFGEIHFNLYEPNDREHILDITDKISDLPNSNDAWIDDDHKGTGRAHLPICVAAVKEKNMFCQPFIAIAAIKLYDGSYVYASQPCVLFPRQKINELPYSEGKMVIPVPITIELDGEDARQVYSTKNGSANSNGSEISNFSEGSGFYTPHIIDAIAQNDYDYYADNLLHGFINSFYPNAFVDSYKMLVGGSDLVLSVSPSLQNALNESDVISSLCIFITTEAELYDKDKEGLSLYEQWSYNQNYLYDSVSAQRQISGYSFKQRTRPRIVHDLIHSPFFLLREYNKNTINELIANPVVDLTLPEYDGLLENITQQKRLTTEALARPTYVPKVSYMYNGRLHIADYKSYPFFGYPIDLFHLHNHSVKVQDGAWFPADADGQRVLPNLADNNDAYLQYPKEQIEIKDAAAMGDSGELIEEAAPYFLVKVYIDTAQGKQIVTRYIPAYDPSTQVEGRADFIEDLNPLLTYPDARAKKMQIYYVDHYTDSQAPLLNGYYLKRKEFTLKPHPYLNMAYYIDPELKPIKLSDFDNWPVVQPIQ